jgi:hypothetical protein
MFEVGAIVHHWRTGRTGTVIRVHENGWQFDIKFDEFNAKGREDGLTEKRRKDAFISLKWSWKRSDDADAADDVADEDGDDTDDVDTEATASAAEAKEIPNDTEAAAAAAAAAASAAEAESAACAAAAFVEAAAAEAAAAFDSGSWS